MSPSSKFKGGHEDWRPLPSSRTPNPSRGGGPKDVYEMITHPIHSPPHGSDPGLLLGYGLFTPLEVALLEAPINTDGQVVRDLNEKCNVIT